VPSPILAPPPIEGAVEANRRAPQPPIPAPDAKPAPRPIAVVKKK
jgi:hypothetical protein